MDLEEDDDEGQQPTKAPTSAEAHESLNVLRSYTFASDNPVCAEEMMDFASRIESLLIMEVPKRLHQTTISDSFNSDQISFLSSDNSCARQGSFIPE